MPAGQLQGSPQRPVASTGLPSGHTHAPKEVHTWSGAHWHAVLQLPAASGSVPAGHTQCADPSASAAQVWPAGHMTASHVVDEPHWHVVGLKARPPGHWTSGQEHPPFTQYWPAGQSSAAQGSVVEGSQFPSPSASAQHWPATHTVPAAQLHSAWWHAVSAPQPSHASPVAPW